jgi:hypothetical protein
MRKMIGYGVPLMRDIEFVGFDREKDPERLEFGVWMEFVPMKFKPLAEKAIRHVMEDLGYHSKPYNEDTRIMMILDMRDHIRKMMYRNNSINLR